MHEMALMGDILHIVEADATSKGIQLLQKVELIVGEVSNAMPDALQMAFDIYKEQNPHLFDACASLVIHVEKAEAECIFCGDKYRPEHRIALCPSCRMPSGKIISGETFQVLSYEGREQK